MVTQEQSYLTEETWRSVPGFEGLYEVSDHGRVRTIGRPFKQLRQPKPMSLGIDGSGYLVVSLRPFTGKRRQYRVSVLVLMAFVGPRPEGLQGAHLDGRKGNNHLSNLAWVTCKENIGHRELHGTTPRGSRSGKSKLTESAVIEMRCKHAQGVASYKTLSSEYGVCKSTVRFVLKRATWAHI